LNSYQLNFKHILTFNLQLILSGASFDTVKQLTTYDILEDDHIKPKHVVLTMKQGNKIWQYGNNHAAIETFIKGTLIELKINS
jgi:hypothetical protein